MPKNERPLEWIGSSHKDLMALPVDVRRLFGFALSLAQAGDKHDAAKVLKGFGGAGVLEVVEDDVGGTYRAVYTIKFAEAVFVLHCFQKKSKRLGGVPRQVASDRHQQAAEEPYLRAWNQSLQRGFRLPIAQEATDHVSAAGTRKTWT